MRSTFLPFVIAFVFFVSTSSFGQNIELSVDPSQSNLTIGVLGASDTSSLSGTGSLILTPTSKPFSTAQIADLSLSADDGFSFSVLLFVSISSPPGSAMLDMVMPGPAGNVDNANQFTQLDNLIQFLGVIDVDDPFGLAGGSMTVDLSTTAPVSISFENVQLSVNEGIVSVAASVDVALDLNGFEVTTVGAIVLNGELPDSFLIGDINQDGAVNLLDVSPFVTLLSEGMFQLEADINQDGEVNLLDVSGFVDLLASGG